MAEMRACRSSHGASAISVAAAILLLAGRVHAQIPPPDKEWVLNAKLDTLRTATEPQLGAVQGVAVRDGKIYAYGDVYSARPRVGVMREYTTEFAPTGRYVWLSQNGRPLIVHPTGLTWNERWGTLLGDTVQKKAMIYRLDWERAWQDGNLDNAVRTIIDDDAAINGCRPTFVAVDGRTYIATSDYGDVRPELRIYDPDRLLAARRSSAPGVIVHRLSCGAFNQNMYWDAASGRLTCAQNVIEGRGWRLEVFDLARAIAAGRSDAPDARVALQTFASHDELEGFWPIAEDRVLLAVARRQDNLLLGTIRKVEPTRSPPGTH
jgi:hypothetical protein